MPSTPRTFPASGRALAAVAALVVALAVEWFTLYAGTPETARGRLLGWYAACWAAFAVWPP